MLSLFPCLFCLYLFIFNIACFTYFFMGVYILKYKWQNLLLLLLFFCVEDVELYLIIVRKTKKYKYTALFGVGVQLYHIIVSQPCTQLRFPYSILYMNRIQRLSLPQQYQIYNTKYIYLLALRLRLCLSHGQCSVRDALSCPLIDYSDH